MALYPSAERLCAVCVAAGEGCFLKPSLLAGSASASHAHGRAADARLSASDGVNRPQQPQAAGAEPLETAAPVVPAAAPAQHGAAALQDAPAVSAELHQICTSQLELLGTVFERFGTLSASVYVRTPESLHSGELQLRRVMQTAARHEPGTARLHAALRVGGPDSSLTETQIVAQRVLILPEQGHMVLPLTTGTFLVRRPCVVPSGFTVTRGVSLRIRMRMRHKEGVETYHSHD